ncbi:lactonase family protein [Leifsonia sp. NPDC058292]|uniref:lactonase family protein n=1 Tax=Leifsonia sp. NPDC058292 TaxID=3346428 RepID=UPI0036DF3C00
MASDLLIGTYTQHLPHVDGRADGILAAVFDGAGIEDVRLAAAADNPSWVTSSRDGSRVYAAIETEPDGAIAAFARDEDGVLTALGESSSGGAAPAYLTLDPSERFVVAGTYGGGSLSVFALAGDGSLGERVSFVQHEGHGPNAARQEAPHVHQVSFDPVTGDLVVVDLGLGEVRFYDFGADGSVELRPEVTVSSGAAGPRHLAFHPGGGHAFVVNELDNTIDLLRREGDRFARVSTASTRPADAVGESSAAAVRVSSSGRTVFVTNRGDDSVAVFAFESEGAEPSLALVATVPTRGATPRDLVVSPEGDRILVANQDGGSVAVFAFDDAERTLEFVSLTAAPTPVCLRFVG